MAAEIADALVVECNDTLDVARAAAKAAALSNVMSDLAELDATVTEVSTLKGA